MVNSIYELNSGFETCMFIDALLILPIIYLLDAAAPLVAYYSAVIYYGFYMAEITRQHAWLIFMVVLYLLGFAYVIMNRKKTEDVRHIYTVWVSVIAAAATGFIFTLALEAGFFAMLTAMCIGIYALDKNGSWSLPYHTLGLLGGACVSVAATFAWEPDSYWYGESSSLEKTAITAIACLIIVSACVFSGRKTFFKNREKVVFCSCAAVCMILELISENTSLMGSTAIFIIIFVMTIVQAVSLIAEGAKVGRFLPLNIGLVMIAALISFLVLEQDFGTLATGILLVMMGGGLLFVNYVLAKKRQLSEEKEVVEDA
ncbi:MAG: hypothetical protein GX851_00360 [Clostridiales bacterium]|nr:hypothetical protein [Clostridiales bacterium]